MAQSEVLPYVTVILEDLTASLLYSASVLTIDDDEEDSHMDVDLDWQLLYHALTVTVLAKILRVFPTFANQDDKIEWHLIVAHLLFPHAWVMQASGSFILHVTCSTISVRSA